MLIQSQIFLFYFNPHQDPIDQKEARGRKKNCKRCLSPFFFFFFFFFFVLFFRFISCDLFSAFKSWSQLAWGWGRHPSAPQRRPLSLVSHTKCLFSALSNGPYYDTEKQYHRSSHHVLLFTSTLGVIIEVNIFYTNTSACGLFLLKISPR